MPVINFNTIPDPEDYQPIPEGKYLTRLIKIDEDTTKNGDPMWKLKFEVAKGEYKGRQIHDNLVFTEKAMPRVKLICKRMGLDVSGQLDLTPTLIHGVAVGLEVNVEEYMASDGTTKKRNSVPYAGYHQVGDGEAVGMIPPSQDQAPEVTEDLPF